MTAIRRRPVTGTCRMRRMSLRRTAALLAAMLGLTLFLPAHPASAAATDAWASPSGGRGNAMHNAGEATITAATAARVGKAWEVRSPGGSGGTPPTVVGTVAYYLDDPRNVDDTKRLVAASARTGQALWQVELSRGVNRYLTNDGVTVSGSLVLIPFNKPFESVGITAVDRYRRTIAWTSTVPGDTGAHHSWSSHEIHTDGTRAFMVSNRTLYAFRLGDGKLLWTVPLDDNIDVGVAVATKTLYLGYGYGDHPGITAYDTATGRRLWTAPGYGTPVVAGGRVFSLRHGTLHAVNAAGCGRTTCPALWSKKFPVGRDGDIALGGADAGSVFVSYQKLLSGSRYYDGVLVRLSAATGAQQWTRTVGAYVGPPVRGGDAVWVINSYIGADGRAHGRILGFPATGTRTTSLRNIAIEQSGSPQSLSIGGGTLLHRMHIPDELVGYRVSGT